MKPDYLQVNPVYEPGMRLRIDVETMRERKGEDRHRITHVDLQVLEAEADKTVLAWRPQWTEVLTGPDDSDLPVNHQLAEELAGLWFEVVLDGDGLYLGISNDGLIKETLGKFCEAFVAGTVWINEEQRQAAGRIFTPAFIFERAQREIVLYFGAGGKRFPINEPARFSQELANVLGGERQHAEFVLEAKAGPGVGEFTVLFEQNADMRPVLARILELGAQPLPEDLDLTGARLIDLSEYVIDADSGLARTVRFTRRSNIREFGVFDFMEVRLVS